MVCGYGRDICSKYFYIKYMKNWSSSNFTHMYPLLEIIPCSAMLKIVCRGYPFPNSNKQSSLEQKEKVFRTLI